MLETVHGRPSLEGHIFPYQVSPTKCVLLSKCKCDGMVSLRLPNSKVCKGAVRLLLVKCYDNKMVCVTLQPGHLPVYSASGG